MNIAIISVPYSLDEHEAGMGKAPAALLEAGLSQRLESAGCTVRVAEPVLVAPSDEPRPVRVGRVLAQLAAEVARARAAGAFPLVLGGDCMCALGVLAGLLDPGDTGVAWIDAHGDFNTPETTVSGYLGGMPLACAVGRGLDELRAAAGLADVVPEANVALIGVRDLDPQEQELLAGSGVAVVPGDELSAGPKALNRALGVLGELTQLYLHVDIDVLDPELAPGVDYPTAGGMTVDALQAVVQRIAGMGNLAALALTAVNPEKDPDGRSVAVALDVIAAAVTEAVNAEL